MEGIKYISSNLPVIFIDDRYNYKYWNNIFTKNISTYIQDINNWKLNVKYIVFDNMYDTACIYLYK